MVAWVLHWRRNATVLDPPELAEEVAERLELLSERHSSDFEPADVVRTVPTDPLGAVPGAGVLDPRSGSRGW